MLKLITFTWKRFVTCSNTGLKILKRLNIVFQITTECDGGSVWDFFLLLVSVVCLLPLPLSVLYGLWRFSLHNFDCAYFMFIKMLVDYESMNLSHLKKIIIIIINKNKKINKLFNQFFLKLL